MLRFDTPLAHARAVAFLEGVSYVLLLFVAMPLKYLADQPMAVRIAGSIHGFLFVWLGLAVLLAMRRAGRTVSWGALVMGVSLLPFGAFVLDRTLARQVAEDDERRAGEA